MNSHQLHESIGSYALELGTALILSRTDNRAAFQAITDTEVRALREGLHFPAFRELCAAAQYEVVRRGQDNRKAEGSSGPCRPGSCVVNLIFSTTRTTAFAWPSTTTEPRCVAKDVAKAIDLIWSCLATIRHVPAQWKGVRSVDTPFGQQEMAVLTEQGLYFFLTRATRRKPYPSR